MKNIIKDIEQNCPECQCSVEETIKYLTNHGDLSYTSDHYREVWFFYIEALKMLKNKAQARRHTIEMFKISPEKFKVIKRKLGS